MIRAKKGVANKYLHFILRSAMVKEQFRKFSTGSSYPAILDSDVEKTIVPMPDETIQKEIAKKVTSATEERNKKIVEANTIWQTKMDGCIEDIKNI